MYYIIAEIPSGELVQVSTEPIDAYEGQIRKLRQGDIPDLNKFMWDKGSLSFIEKRNTRVITKRQFLGRITPDEYSNIKIAASMNAQVDYFWQMFTISDEIDLDFPDTIYGLNMLEQAGLLSSGRASEILS